MLVTITVPASSPIDAELPEQELAAQAIIEQAKLQGGRRVTGHWEKVRAGQAGRADRRRGARDARAGDRHAAAAAQAAASLFGKTLETVLAERPCRVIIQTGPDGASAGEAPDASRAAARLPSACPIRDSPPHVDARPVARRWS